MIARRLGRCCACGSPIVPGELIERDLMRADGRRWSHTACIESFVAALNARSDMWVAGYTLAEIDAAHPRWWAT